MSISEIFAALFPTIVLICPFFYFTAHCSPSHYYDYYIWQNDFNDILDFHPSVECLLTKSAWWKFLLLIRTLLRALFVLTWLSIPVFILTISFMKKKDFFQLQHEILEGNPGFFFPMNWGKISYSLVPSSHFRNKIFFPIVSMGLFVSKKLNKAATLPFFFSICVDKVNGFKIVLWVHVAHEVAAVFNVHLLFCGCYSRGSKYLLLCSCWNQLISLKTKFAFDLLHVLLSFSWPSLGKTYFACELKRLNHSGFVFK